MKLKYIGTQPRKQDRWFGTGVTWDGHADIKDVPDEIGAQMIESFPAIWKQVDAKTKPAPKEQRKDEAPANPDAPNDVNALADESVRTLFDRIKTLPFDDLAQLREVEESKDKPRSSVLKAIDAEMERQAV